MKVLIVCGWALSALSTGAAAQDIGDHRGQVEIVADTVTSAQTCSQIGYSVDFEGIVRFESETRATALSGGVVAEEYDQLISERITGKYEWLHRKYRRVALMVENSENRVRYKRFWQKRCQRLGKNAQTSALFTKTLS